MPHLKIITVCELKIYNYLIYMNHLRYFLYSDIMYIITLYNVEL